MKTRIFVLAACLLAFASHAQETTKELWKWTDANGVVHYSDVPGPGATKVDLTVTEAPSRAAVTPAPASAKAAPAKPTAPATVNYTSLEIWQPESGASFFEADTTVSVRIRSEPAVSPDDRLLLFLDGKLVEGAADNAIDYSLSNLERGAHSVTAQIIDVNGKEKIRSQPVVFHMKQVTTIAPRAVGPNLKAPPARPTPRGG